MGFFVFTNIKEYMLKYNPKHSKSWYTDFLSGAVGALFGQASNNNLI